MRACVTLKLAVSGAQDGRASAAEFWIPAQFGPTLHIHHGEDELLQVIEGTVRIVCGDIDPTVGPGAFAYLPRGVPQAFWVQGNEPARMLAIFTPGGAEQMLADSGVPTDAAHLPESDGTPPGGLDALMAHYRVEHIGSPVGA
jgi:mannose-6-phosphate isomerase-like protein (cupin superfamily)